ncbi:MAG: SUMF1/EgtB/PvdO family nonheme iron enzyme [Planctomycetes bacterium]|nr:SUMF1/EgtB/PvdO family nonheme iron enzyme [Planctomycetota bacterium]
MSLVIPPPADSAAEPSPTSPSAAEMELLDLANDIGYGQSALARLWLNRLRSDVAAASDPDKERTAESLLLAWEKATENGNESIARDGDLRGLASCLVTLNGTSLLEARRRVCERLRTRGLRRLQAGDLAGATEDLRTASEVSPDPWAARADLARAEAAGGDPDRARELEFDVARHALSAGAPGDAIAAVDRLLERPGADSSIVAGARLLRGTAALALARTENEAARRSRVLGDVVAANGIPAIESFAALGDVAHFGEAVALIGQGYREIGEDGRLRQLPSLLAARYPARVETIESALKPLLDSISSTATVGIARTDRAELLLPDGAHAEVVASDGTPHALSTFPVRVPVADASGTTFRLRLGLRDGRRLEIPLMLLAGDNVRLDLDRVAQGFVFVPDRNRDGQMTSITPGFYMERTEVSNSDFAVFVNSPDAGDLRARLDRRGDAFLMSWRRVPRTQSGDVAVRPNEGDRPVTFVSPDEACRYATWRGGVLGVPELRLPTTIEWLAAARTAEGKPYPWGYEWSNDRCNAFEDDDTGESESVDAHPLGDSYCGVRQIAGNVAEIVVAADGAFFARGGSYRHSRVLGQPTLLDEQRAIAASERAIDVGFRCMAPPRPAPMFTDGLPQVVATDAGRHRR